MQSKCSLVCMTSSFPLLNGHVEDYDVSPAPSLPDEEAVDGGMEPLWCGTGLGSPQTPFLFILAFVTPSSLAG